VAASYLLLVPHYIGGSLLPAGTIVTEGGAIPIGWVPTAAVDPLNAQAIQNYFNAGPQSVAGGEYSRDYYWSQPITKDEPGVKPPQVQWRQVSGHAGAYQLTGAGASLGVRSSA
jgi:hypothetical protein